MAPRLLTFEVPGNEALFISPHRLCCYEWGNPDSPHIVVCAHGLTRNGRDFDFLAEELSPRFRVLCPDIPGRGMSDWLANPAGYSYPAYVFEMQYMLASLRLSRVHWLGTSMGGIIGMMLAGAQPGLLQSLTLNDIGCVVSRVGLKRILSYAGMKMRFESRAEGEATLRSICAPFGISEEKHWRHLFDSSLEDLPGGGVRFRYDPNIAGVLPPLDAVIDINLWALWPAVTFLPVLLIRGAESDILTRADALTMQEQHPALTYHEIAGAGHAPALMAGDQIALVRQWLDQRL